MPAKFFISLLMETFRSLKAQSKLLYCINYFEFLAFDSFLQDSYSWDVESFRPKTPSFILLVKNQMLKSRSNLFSWYCKLKDSVSSTVGNRGMSFRLLIRPGINTWPYQWLGYAVLAMNFYEYPEQLLDGRRRSDSGQI